jgi:hypothetical protein
MLAAFLLLAQILPAARPVEKPAAERSAEITLLGRTNTQAGEARRNENNFITPLDNNAQRESSMRLGTTATAVEEFSSATRYFGTEFGISPVAPLHLANAVNRAGLHGNLLWTHGNSLLSARSFFQVGDVLPARENTVGLRFTLPLSHGFFFTLDAAEERRSGYVNGNVLVPTADERSCLSTDAAVCRVVDRFLRAWPTQTPNRTDIASRFLNTNSAQSIDTQNVTSRVDRVSDRHSLSLRHTWTTQQVDAFQLVAGQNPDTTTQGHDARLSWLWRRSAKEQIQTTLGFLRTRTLLAPEPNAVGPQVIVGTAWERLGPGSSIPVDRAINRYRVAVRYARSFSRHQFSASAELQRLHFNGSEASSNRGNIYFRNDFGRDAITNFRLGAVSRYSFGAGELARGFRRWEPQLSFTDSWRVNNALSLNFGLRFQPQPGIREVNQLTSIPFRCDCNNLGPFAGFAWRLPQKLGVFRAAYATAFGEVFPATLQQLRWNPPNFQKIENQTPPLLDLLRGVAFDPNARAIVFRYPENLQTPYSHQYNATWQTPLPPSLGQLHLEYIGSRTWKLLYMLYLNRATAVPGIPLTTATINNRRPNQRLFDDRVVDNISRAWFDAFRLRHALPLRRGLTAEASWWISRAIDTGSGFVNIAAGDDANQNHSQTALGVADDLRGVSNFDQQHAFTTRLSWEVPARQRWLRHWRSSAVFVAKSGIPFTAITGSDGPGFGNVDGVGGDRPHLLDPSVLGRTISHPDLAATLLPRPAFAFLRPGDLRGNLGNNTFRRAGYRNLNASLDRRFALHRDWTLAFRAESINLMNTPQFAEPIADLSNPAFGRIVNTLNDGRTFRFSLSLAF